MTPHPLELHMTPTQRRAALLAAFRRGAKVKTIVEVAVGLPKEQEPCVQNAFAHVAVGFDDHAAAQTRKNFVYGQPAYRVCTTVQTVHTYTVQADGVPLDVDGITRADLRQHIAAARDRRQRYVAVIEQFLSRQGEFVFAQHVIMAQDSHDIVRAIREKGLRAGAPRAVLYAVIDVQDSDDEAQLRLAPATLSKRNLSVDAYAAYRAYLDVRQKMDQAQAAKNQGMLRGLWRR